MQKRLSLMLAFILAALCVLAALPASADTTMWVQTKTGRVLNVRSAKVVSKETKIGALPNGSAVTVLKVEDGWAEIVYQPAGASAPISPAYVQADLLTDTAPVKYNAAAASLPSPLVYESATVSELNNQFVTMQYVDSYDVLVTPDTQTGVVRLSWGPSGKAAAVTFLASGTQVTVLASGGAWLMVMEPGSGKIGFVPAKYTAAP